MAAAITDLVTQATVNSRPTPTTVSSTRSAAGAILSCLALTGWPTGTAVHFITYKINTSGAKIAGSQADWKGIVSGTTITNLTLKAGTDVGNAVGDIVEASPTAAYANDLVTWGTAQHNQDGTHAAVTATSVSAGTVAGTTSVSDAGQTLQTYRADVLFDHVASGCVWTADSAGSTRVASMTAGVVYIGGKRVVVAAVTSRTFTASKDVYVDIDNTGTFTYTDNTTNAASPAQAANSIRLGIIVVGASNIATAASVNQGQEDRVLPIASSIPYTVTDSLGNLICPRDPNRKILGYRQSTTTFSTSSTTAVQITGLVMPVIVPLGRKIKVSFVCRDSYNTTNNAGANSIIVDGLVGVGSQIQAGIVQATSAIGVAPVNISVITTPAVASKTYTAGLNTTVAGSAALEAASSYPMFIMAELV